MVLTYSRVGRRVTLGLTDSMLGIMIVCKQIHYGGGLKMGVIKQYRQYHSNIHVYYSCILLSV